MTLILLLTFAGLVSSLLTLPGSLELLLLTAASLRRTVGKPLEGPRCPIRKLAILVPAHNEEERISACVNSLLKCKSTHARVDVIVVVDNCADSTGDLAARSGARILIRRDDRLRGKGYALDHAFRQLMTEGYDAFLIVDADTIVTPNLVEEVEHLLGAGADAVQCAYRVRNADASFRTRLLDVATTGFNVLRPRGRANLGLSVGIYGNGFALTRSTLQAVPYRATSVVEDLEYHLLLVCAGRKVVFSERAKVFGEMPSGGQGARTQRSRWEGGRLHVLRAYGLDLLGRILQGQFHLIETLLDLLLLPLSFHALLLGVVLLAPVPVLRGYALFSLSILAFHAFRAAMLTGRGAQALLDLVFAPVYVAWKAAILPSIVKASTRNAEWIRTRRESLLERTPL